MLNVYEVFPKMRNNFIFAVVKEYKKLLKMEWLNVFKTMIMLIYIYISVSSQINNTTSTAREKTPKFI